MNDNSESCSSSGSSYSARLGSYRRLASRPVSLVERFLQNISKQFRRMTRAKSSTVTPIRPFEGLVPAHIQQSGEGGSEETVEIIYMLIQIRPPGFSPEIIMYETNGSTSSSRNAKGASKKKFKAGSLAAILLSRDFAFGILNFPQLDEFIKSFINNGTNKKSGEKKDDGQVSKDIAGNGCSVINVKGEVRVYASGRATLSIGGKDFVLAKVAKPQHLVHQVVCTDTKNRERSLGLVKYYIDVLPNKEVGTGEKEQQ